MKTYYKEVIKKYLENKISYAKLAKEFNVNRNTISVIIKNAGIKSKYFVKLPEDKIIIDLYLIEKLAIEKIAKKFNCSISPIKKILRRNNINIRNDSERHIGQKAWNKDKKWSNEVIEKLRKKALGKYKKENNPNWRGGISFEHYSDSWTKILKFSIKKRDKFICNICGKNKKLVVHHIDYNKKNCNPDNLITLCVNCHAKTNFKRDNWIKYFTNRVKRGNS